MSASSTNIARLALLLIAGLYGCSEQEVTYSGDIARIVNGNCASCHRPGQSAPFPLLTHADVKRRAKQIVEVTQSRYMPPWLPDDEHDFLGSRRLEQADIDLLARWLEQDCPEGDAALTPDPPTFNDDWVLGPPDLIALMPEAFVVPAGGPDLYRNFVIPNVTDKAVWVRTLEFRPGNNTVAHHAFVAIDASDSSVTHDKADEEPGYDGIHTSGQAATPSGFFLSWTPGRHPVEEREGLAWQLPAGADIVLQMHLQPSGKPEEVRAGVGLYFADGPPTLHPRSIAVASQAIDIPAGTDSYIVKETFKIPVAVEVLAVVPHAHFLGKKLRGSATLPDGKSVPLIHIPRWDFNWQESYHYEQPLDLPAGTQVSMQYEYDNSAANPFNPSNPPQPVGYGRDTLDEMGELWLQVLAKTESDLPALDQAITRSRMQWAMDLARRDIARDPDDAKALLDLAKSLHGQGQAAEARDYYEKAAAADPAGSEALLMNGVLYQQMGQLPAAERLFRQAVKAEPNSAVNQNAHGEVLLQLERLPEAQVAMEWAVQRDPYHFNAQLNLGIIYARSGAHAKALLQFQRCLELRPGDAQATQMLRMVQGVMAEEKRNGR